MQCELKRLSTFNDYNPAPGARSVSFVSLANDGFYLVKDNGVQGVRCHYCSYYTTEFSPDVIHNHGLHNPHCEKVSTPSTPLTFLPPLPPQPTPVTSTRTPPSFPRLPPITTAPSRPRPRTPPITTTPSLPRPPPITTTPSLPRPPPMITTMRPPRSFPRPQQMTATTTTSTTPTLPRPPPMMLSPLNKEQLLARFPRRQTATDVTVNKFDEAWKESLLPPGQSKDGIFSTSPINTAFSDVCARTRSFPDDWNDIRPVKVRDLVDAGFFFLFKYDRCRCFYCHVILHGWSRGDVPWIEHARYKPTCTYVHLKKGPLFVQVCGRLDGKVSMDIVIGEARRLGYISRTLCPNLNVSSGNCLLSCAVQTLIALGYPYDEFRHVVVLAIMHGRTLSAVELLRLVKSLGIKSLRPLPAKRDGDTRTDEEIISLSTQMVDQCTCVICVCAVVDIAHIPCGHAVCLSCSLRVATCALCRGAIKGRVRVRLPC